MINLLVLIGRTGEDDNNNNNNNKNKNNTVPEQCDFLRQDGQKPVVYKCQHNQ